MITLEYKITAYLFITIVSWFLLKPVLYNSKCIYVNTIGANIYKIFSLILILLFSCNLGDLIYNWKGIYIIISLILSSIISMYCIIYLIITNSLQTIIGYDTK